MVPFETLSAFRVQASRARPDSEFTISAFIEIMREFLNSLFEFFYLSGALLQARLQLIYLRRIRNLRLFIFEARSSYLRLRLRKLDTKICVYGDASEKGKNAHPKVSA